MQNRLKLFTSLLFIQIMSVGAFAGTESSQSSRAGLKQIQQYRYLEARSQDFLEEFDRSLSPLNESNYADLIATRVLRENLIDKIAQSLLDASETPTEKVLLKELGSPKLKGAYYLSQPLVQSVLAALSDGSDRRKALIARKNLEKILSPSDFDRLGKMTFDDSILAESRREAKTYSDAKDMENLISRVSDELRESGLSASREKKAKDRGPAGNDLLGFKGAINGSEFPQKMWAITYDDGPASFTESILNELKKRDIKATFFWLSSRASSYEKTIIPRAIAEGHELANHSATHKQLNKLGEAGLDKEIDESTAILSRLYRKHPRFFRLPYGAGVTTPAIRSRLAKLGMVHVMWNVDSLDWQDHNATSIFNRVMKQVQRQGHGVILFHDIHQRTITASSQVMDALKSDGNRLVSVQEAMNVLNTQK